MNSDGLYQEARDCAEEALLCAHQSDELYFGLYVRFSLYSKQMNVIDSLLNGCLLLTSLLHEEKVSEILINTIYIEIFISLRTFNFFKYSRDIYNRYIVSLKLSEYQRQQCDLAMFYMGLMENDSGVVNKSDIYLRNNKENIAMFGKSSLIPWLAFICNVKTIFPKEFACSNLFQFENEIALLLSQQEIESVKNKILKERAGSKEEIMRGLINLSRTRNRSDLIHEVNQLVVTANRVIETSILNKDVEGVLLAHQLKSDGSVYFSGRVIEEKSGIMQQAFNLDDENSSRFKKYLEYVKGSLSERTSIQYVWLGINEDKLYCIVFENGSFSFCDYIESTNKKEIIEWVSNHLPTLGFEDAPKTINPFITREEYWRIDKDSILEALPSIDIPISSSELVLFSDVEFSCFPHNMIKCNNKIIALEQGISSPLSFDKALD